MKYCNDGIQINFDRQQGRGCVRLEISNELTMDRVRHVEFVVRRFMASFPNEQVDALIDLKSCHSFDEQTGWRMFRFCSSLRDRVAAVSIICPDVAKAARIWGRFQYKVLSGAFVGRYRIVSDESAAQDWLAFHRRYSLITDSETGVETDEKIPLNAS